MADDMGNKRPGCQAPNCEAEAFMLIGTKFYCGEHAIKVSQILQEQREKYIEERLKSATN